MVEGHPTDELTSPHPRSQTPAWERPSAKLRFAPDKCDTLDCARNGASRKWVPEPELGNPVMLGNQVVAEKHAIRTQPSYDVVHTHDL
jgi:hypothetical protein